MLVAASGCGVTGPGYQRPAVPMNAQYRQPVPSGPSLADLEWWQVFRDPALTDLIRLALRNNNDLARATERVEEARYNVGFVRADQFPQGTATLAPGFNATKNPLAQSLSKALVSVNYDADLFGKLRKSTKAARIDLLSSAYARRVVGITLVSQVAQAYLELRDLDARVEVLKRTLASRQSSLKLINDRFTLGIGSEVEVVQAQREVESAAGDIPDLEVQLKAKEHELCELTGQPPGPIARGLALPEQPMAIAVPAGLPAQLLSRRPDVREAEMELVAQHERIDIAKTFYFPDLTLTGAGGAISSALHLLLHEGTGFASLVPNLTGPIFTFGKNKRRVNIEEARYRQLVASYRGVVLKSLREVEDALAGAAGFAEELTHLETRVALSRKALELSQLRYESGVAAYLEVLDSQRELLLAELAISIIRRNRLVSIVQLYRSLGGGWPYTPPESLKFVEKLEQGSPPEPATAAATTSVGATHATTQAPRTPPESD